MTVRAFTRTDIDIVITPDGVQYFDIDEISIFLKNRLTMETTRIFSFANNGVVYDPVTDKYTIQILVDDIIRPGQYVLGGSYEDTFGHTVGLDFTPCIIRFFERGEAVCC